MSRLKPPKPRSFRLIVYRADGKAIAYESYRTNDQSEIIEVFQANIRAAEDNWLPGKPIRRKYPPQSEILALVTGGTLSLVAWQPDTDAQHGYMVVAWEVPA